VRNTRACAAGIENLGRALRKGRRGAAAVEFAVVLPIFIILVFGMIEYGRMVMVQQVITNASREGARRAVLDGATTSAVQSSVTTYLTNAQISGGSATVSPDPSTANSGDPITVTVNIPFSSVSWLPSPMYLGGKTLSASTTMRRESVE
jgi:Flp pilus assembly protein TadG